jgi:alpha-beta hydrolase superfamily lysophospholipase
MGESMGGLVSHKASLNNESIDGIILLNPACSINPFLKYLSSFVGSILSDTRAPRRWGRNSKNSLVDEYLK